MATGVTRPLLRSGERVETGTEGTRRRLTEAEAMAGGLPTPFTAREWRTLRRATLAYAHGLGLPDIIRAPRRHDS